MKNSKESGEPTISMLNFLIVHKIADIMESKMPFESDASKEIIESYIKDGSVSDKGINFIVLAIENKFPYIKFKEIADNEAGILPSYMKKMGERFGMSVQEFREKVRKDLS